MSKKARKRSSKGGNTGTRLGALALIISILALGLSVYQWITPPVVDVPETQVYINEYDPVIFLDGISMIDYLYPLNITYTTEVGDTVKLEFSCLIYLDPMGTTSLGIYFDDNSSIYPANHIYVATDTHFWTSGYMTYTYEATTAGSHYLVIWASIDDEGTNSNIRDCLLTVTVTG